MKSTIYLLSLLVLTFSSCKGSETTTPDQKQEQVSPVKKSNAFTVNGRLKLSGTNMVNQKGIPVQLRGMSTHGLQYRGNCYSEQSLNVLMNDWGADILRISMYVQEGGYESLKNTQPKAMFFMRSVMSPIINSLT
ncbi:MAG: hypothetical protein EOO86_07660 [Pedobacter sp.]|nr:MAG: hypothetical protein EOO86_07660 [Pedobacter sp.]